MKRLAALALIVLAAACATKEPEPTGGTMVGEVSDARNRAKVHTELAGAYFERGNMGVALDELRQATAADSSYPQAYGLLGLVYMELKDKVQAESNFERGLRLSPNDADINHNYGWFLCQNGREKDSIKYFLQALRNPLYSSPGRTYSAAGLCSLRANNPKDAEEFFQRALRLDPDDPTSLLQLGQIRFRQGNIEEARRLVSRYNKLVSPNPESLWLAVKIERKLGERVTEQSYANQLRRRFPNSAEYQSLQRGQYD
ncbi:MAG TPA: type IV pilus biogenesis/stability protein PilW [Burkholderiales bacterium]|jgi:type IV pilus assembly protein PilF|nr:type IV pilus biogenesis/stability protein PilW [Burkholderiales bacterium]